MNGVRRQATTSAAVLLLVLSALTLLTGCRDDFLLGDHLRSCVENKKTSHVLPPSISFYPSPVIRGTAWEPLHSS